MRKKQDKANGLCPVANHNFIKTNKICLHIISTPHHFINKIKCCMNNKLVQMGITIFLFKMQAKNQLRKWLMPNGTKVRWWKESHITEPKKLQLIQIYSLHLQPLEDASENLTTPQVTFTPGSQTRWFVIKIIVLYHPPSIFIGI